MNNQFFERPILNSPYDYPTRYWELDEQGQPTQQIVESRRKAEFITPIPKPRKRQGRAAQAELVFDEGKGLSTEKQQYDATSAEINELRYFVDQWRGLPNPHDWKVTPDTQRLLQHWRHHKFSDIRPFFCQIEAVETAIWLTEVAPQMGKTGKRFRSDTQRLLQHWRHHKFSDIRPFFCQIEAVETAIWLTEVAPQMGKTGKRFLEH